jgi:3-methyladenine DNA glycosylase AlkD
MTHQILLQNLEQELQALGNSIRAQQQQRYMKSSMPFFGVQKPMVTQVAKPLIRHYKATDHADYCATILYLFKQAKQREIWHAALDYAMAHKKYIIPESIPTYLEIIRFAAWWDIVDVVADHLIGKALLQISDPTLFFHAWINDEHLWVRRTALIAQLKYKEKTHTELLAHCITTTMHEKNFFIRKAIGWSLRSYSYTNPEWVMQFIATHKARLSALSAKEALKAIERKK